MGVPDQRRRGISVFVALRGPPFCPCHDATGLLQQTFPLAVIKVVSQAAAMIV